MIHNIEVESGKSVKLSTAGKYCDRDIVVAGKGPTEADLQTKYDEGVQAEYDRIVDETKIIPTAISGSVLYVNDVSEIPHSCTLLVDKTTTVTVFGKNLLDRSQIVIGGLVGPTGADWDTNTQMRSDYIPVAPKQAYTVSGTSYKVNKIHYYDTNMAWLGRKEGATSFVTPEKARYVRLTFGDGGSAKTETDLTTIQEEPIQFERGLVGTTYEPYRGCSEYIIDAGQTVNIDSLCPVMSIFADNDTTITFGYHKSWGMQMEHDRFWNDYQQNGNRSDYSYGFAGRGWNRDNFLPKYDIAPTTLNTCFHSLNRDDADWATFDLVEHLEKLGLVLDTSSCTNLTSAFMWAWIGRIGVIDCRAVTATISNLFGYGKIKTIDKLIVKPENVFTSAFQNQAELVNITFEGIIGSAISFQWSTKLSKASIESIMAALSPTTSGLSVTFSATAVSNAFTDEEWATLANTRPNWTINLV